MPKFVKKEERPVVEAIQWPHSRMAIVQGDWIIRKPNGMVTIASDSEFKDTYEEIK